MTCRRRHRLKGIHSRSDTNRTGADGLSFYYPRLLHCLNQVLAVVLLSQHRVSSSKTLRPRAPYGARCIRHAVSTWSAVCSEAPHSQFGEGARPHLCMDEWNRPTPVRRRLSLTLGHRGLTCKLLRLLPDKHMVKIIMELVRNRRFTLTTGDSKQSRLRRLKNGVPQGSVLAPLLFNIYTYDLPFMISRKFAYADDLALLHSSGSWKDLEETLSQDICTLSAYLQTWRLKLSHTKTVTATFHLNNREAKRELKVYNNGRLLPFCPTPTYLGVKLDRSLTFRHHLVALRKKLSSRVTLLRRLVGSGWGGVVKTLRIATLSLVYSTSEYCAPVWCRSAHTRLIDSVLNDALCIVTGCLRPTPMDHLPVLSGIQPVELRRMGATHSLAYCGSLDPDHILYGVLSGSSDTRQVRLRSRRPFVPAARNLLDNLARLGIRASEWTNHKWKTEYCENASRLRAFVPGTGSRPVGMGLPRAAWVRHKID